MPAVGDEVETRRALLTVVGMEGRRVTRLRVRAVAEADDEQEETR